MLDLAVAWAADLDHALESSRHLMPEIVLVAVACLAILMDLLIPREKSGPTLAWLALAGTLAALAFAWRQFLLPDAMSIFRHAVAVDRFAAFFKIIVLLGTLFSVVFIHESRELRGRHMGEFYGLLFCAVAGMCLMVGATEFVTAFLSIELVSIPSFALVAYVRRDRLGTEAAIKYVLYSAFATGLMLFGMSIIFGLTGSTRFVENSGAAAHGTAGAITLGVAGLLAFAGFAFKMSAAPFHFWTPDVYQGAPTPVTAWLSVTSKAAGIGLFIRFVVSFLSPAVAKGDAPFDLGLAVGGFDWVSALLVISGVTMTIGNFGALFQNSVKRMLAYSSVAHVGYILMGVAAIQAVATTHSTTLLPVAVTFNVAQEGANGGAAAAFYIAAYLFMNLGAFGCVLAVANVTGSDDISSFRALGRRAPLLALSMAVFIFALIGIPPTAGFVGKLQLFMAAIARAQVRPAFWWLIAVAGVNSVVAVYYYLRIAKAMYLEGLLDPEAREPLPVSPALTFVCLFLVLPVIALGIWFSRISEYTIALELLWSR